MSHKIEIAPSGRASCRGCKETIAKGVPRFCEEFANPYGDDGAKSYRYWHLACAATKLANELAPVLAEHTEPLDDRASVEALIAEHLQPPMPYAEHAPNGRARCRACEESVAKGELRVAFERTFEGPMGMQKGAAYVHPRCLGRYLEREKEQGREAPAPGELLRQLEAHDAQAAKRRMGPDDLPALRAALPS